MILLAEIILTIFVWRKGWKWLSLIPVGVAIGFGFILGLAAGVSGGDIEHLKPGIIFVDVLAVVALIVMLTIKPNKKEVEKAD